jgi:hypothetical protein
VANIFGRNLSKSEILRRVGDIEQLAQILNIELKEGNASGVRALDVRNGGGLHFLVIADRGLDITVADINGIPLAIRFHPGEMRPDFHEDHPLAFINNWAGGLMTTCGLTNVGSPGQEGIENLVQHGNYNRIAAKNVQFEGIWEGDEYRLQIRGRVREVAPFYPNLELRRKITTYLGSNKIKIEDEIENIGFKESPFMFLYHTNFGFPLVDESAEVIIKSKISGFKEGAPMDDAGDWNKISAPVHGISERVYYHDVQSGSDGYCKAGILNKNIGDGRKLEVIMRYKKEQLPILSHWKMMAEGEYVVGLEPGNCHVEGRLKEREVFKTLQYIQPGEIRQAGLEFEVNLSES